MSRATDLAPPVKGGGVSSSMADGRQIREQLQKNHLPVGNFRESREQKIQLLASSQLHKPSKSALGAVSLGTNKPEYTTNNNAFFSWI